jgi:thiosulfate/3-mercaptopyruvate sulfurtransferase
MTNYNTLISAEALQALLNSSSRTKIHIFDCSFELAQPDAGAQQYTQAHIPGAVYADLNRALSYHPIGAVKDIPASGGRHPLPNREAFAQWLGSVGMTNDKQAVVYDRQGANYCGRLWWMLQWVGHANVAVLDGGLQAWQAQGGDVETGSIASHTPTPAATTFALQPPLQTLITVNEVQEQLGHEGQTILDARAAPRFKGEVEPLDPAAGHIPGALNRPFTANIDTNGCFKPSAVLRAEFEAVLAGHPANSVVHQCGSGVSAIPNLLAMQIAGLGPTRLFAGSWSEWCSDPSRPVEKG